MARIDAALAAADVEGASCVREAARETEAEHPDGGEAWRVGLRQALDSGEALRLAHYPLRLGEGEARHLECPLRLRLEPDSGWLPASRFLPIAERLGMVRELDLTAVKLAILQLEADGGIAGLWINLSAKSVADPEFRRRLLALLESHPATRDRLHLEVPESGGLPRLEALRGLSRDLKPLRCQLGLEHYGHHFNQIGSLYDLGLDFLKVDASFIHGIDGHPGNQAFLAGLLEIAHRIGMRVYAEGVSQEAELAKLLELGFDGASGPAVG
jgi:EAL domain-containing protein (putative c-di-GMP-specific phosphodiesterase class I)